MSPMFVCAHMPGRMTIARKNALMIMPRLNLDYGVKNEIWAALAAGREVTVSQTNITHAGQSEADKYRGCGYIIFDPHTGAGAYKISGGTHGGCFPCETFNGGFTPETEAFCKAVLMNAIFPPSGGIYLIHYLWNGFNWCIGLTVVALLFTLAPVALYVAGAGAITAELGYASAGAVAGTATAIIAFADVSIFSDFCVWWD